MPSPARRTLTGLVSVLVVAATVVGGSAAFDPAPPPGFHVHQGPHGHVDVNVCSDAVPLGYARCAARVRTEPAATGRIPAGSDRQAPPDSPAAPDRQAAGAQPAGSGTIGDGGAYSPAYLQAAYNLAGANQGVGQTVAIVDAYDDATITTDLATYRAHFGLPACTTATGCFRRVDEHGGSHLPPPSSAWGQEIAIDIDMVSAICPNCHIVLVEAASASLSDLGTGVNTAVALGANVVSNSYGGNEYPGELADNSTYFRHRGVAVVAATGDKGYGVEFPASSSDVTAVGGTSLQQATATGGRGGSEMAWSGTGSGCSSYVAKPAWQHDTGCANRTVADVAAVADPNTGVWVYWASSWRIFGGTSVATPIVASLYALAADVAPGSQPAAYPYRAPAALNDVTSGSNGYCPVTYLCTAGAGYDGPTGLGSPNTAAAFGASPPPPPPTAPGVPGTLSATGGDRTVQLNWSAPSSGGAAVTYRVLRGTSAGAESVVVEGVAATGYTDTALTNGAAYFYQVQAVNPAGASPRSNEVTVTPAVAAALGPPLNLVAVPSGHAIVLSWSAPATDGGSPVTGYRVYRGRTSGTETLATAVTCSAATCTYTDTATHRLSYFYQVAAVTAKAVGPLSNQASAVAH